MSVEFWAAVALTAAVATVLAEAADRPLIPTAVTRFLDTLCGARDHGTWTGEPR